MRDFGLPDLPRARPGPNETKMYNSGSSELPQSRSGSGKPEVLILVHRRCHEPGRAPVNQI